MRHAVISPLPRPQMPKLGHPSFGKATFQELRRQHTVSGSACGLRHNAIEPPRVVNSQNHMSSTKQRSPIQTSHSGLSRPQPPTRVRGRANKKQTGAVLRRQRILPPTITITIARHLGHQSCTRRARLKNVHCGCHVCKAPHLPAAERQALNCFVAVH